jgi:hypothetical protein
VTLGRERDPFSVCKSKHNDDTGPADDSFFLSVNQNRGALGLERAPFPSANHNTVALGRERASFPFQIKNTVALAGSGFISLSVIKNTVAEQGSRGRLVLQHIHYVYFYFSNVGVHLKGMSRKISQYILILKIISVLFK